VTWNKTVLLTDMLTFESILQNSGDCPACLVLRRCVSFVCVQRKSETELRNIINQQKKDVELQRKVQQLESEKQAVDVCVMCACQG